MLVLPERFDSNEWYIILSLIITYSLILFAPKRFPLTITLLMLIFSMTYAQVIDHILAGKSLNLYDINDTEKYEIMDFLAWFLYPPFGYFFIYFYDRWRVSGFKIFLYIFVWVLLSIGVEKVSLIFGLFEYGKWRIWYSIPVYFITLSLYLLFFIKIKNSFYALKNKQNLHQT